MQQRLLGRTGHPVSALGLGCMGLVGWYGERDDAEAAATVARALDLGITHLDTAAVYQDGDNERFAPRCDPGPSRPVSPCRASSPGRWMSPGRASCAGSCWRIRMNGIWTWWADYQLRGHVDLEVPALGRIPIRASGQLTLERLYRQLPGLLRRLPSAPPV